MTLAIETSVLYVGRDADPDSPETGVIVDIEAPEHGGGYYVRWDSEPGEAVWVAEADVREDSR